MSELSVNKISNLTDLSITPSLNLNSLVSTTANITTANITTVNATTANITTANIATANITTANIATANITTANIATANITTANIATSNVANLTITGNLVPPSSFLRNKIINGDMRIDQRNAGASTTPTGPVYTLDRWVAELTQSSKYSVQQVSSTLAGFQNAALFTSLSAYSVLSTDVFDFSQRIEGYNIADFAWGTASAQTVTLSFWVRSSLTGTFGGSIRNSGNTRSYPFSYSIGSANTWTFISVTIPGDTSGTWLTTTSLGMSLSFGLGVGTTYSGTAGTWAAANYLSATGATSVVGTNGATFYITGVQLEVGTVATPFERRLYGQELMLCQRYCTYLSSYLVYEGYINPGGVVITNTALPVPMRASPTVSFISPAYSNASGISTNAVSTSIIRIQVTAGAVAGTAYGIAELQITAEL